MEFQVAGFRLTQPLLLHNEPQMEDFLFQTLYKLSFSNKSKYIFKKILSV